MSFEMPLSFPPLKSSKQQILEVQINISQSNMGTSKISTTWFIKIFSYNILSSAISE